MVVTMKKLQVLLPAADREQFLKKLAKVGVVHIEESEGEHRSQDLETLESKLKSYRTVLKEIEKISQVEGSVATPSSASFNADETVEAFNDLETKRDGILQKIGGIEKDIATLAPWGDFNPEILAKLADASVRVRFYEVTGKQFVQLDLSEVVYAVIEQTSTVRFVVFEHEDTVEIKADEVSLPLKSISSLKREVASLEAEVSDVERQQKAFVPAISLLKETIAAIEVEESFEKARLNLEEGAEGAVLYLSGWFPTKREKSVRDFLSSQTVWSDIIIPKMDELPPVTLKNGTFVKLFEPITKMFSLPDYFELDPTPFFTPFFMFFYGMCLGDVGYGLMLLVFGIILLSKGPHNFKGIFILVTILAGITIVNGLLLNSFFGASIFNVEGVKGIAGSGGVIPFLGPKVIGGKMAFPAMTFSVYIGFTQMLLGMGMHIYNKLKNHGLLYAVQPMCYVPLSLAAFIFLCKANFLNMGTYEINGLQLGTSIASVSDMVMKVLLFVGLVPFVFLNTPTIRIFIRPFRALYELYNLTSDIVSCGLSYLRLFALGLAGGLLGNAFNEIALMILKNDQGEIVLASPLIIFTILIMVAGHSLNFFLSALGAYVHSVRLIFVEFYKFLNFTGGGRVYTPFTENVTKNN